MNTEVTWPVKLEELVTQFEGLPRRDRIDLLLEFAAALPPVPADVRAHEAAAQEVHECLTPVMLFVLPDGDSARIYVEVGAEAPTVNAVSAVLIEGCAGAPREQIAKVPSDLPVRIIGPDMVGQRRIGLAGLVNRIKRAVAELS